jgi:hypothetical protein
LFSCQLKNQIHVNWFGKLYQKYILFLLKNQSIVPGIQCRIRNVNLVHGNVWSPWWDCNQVNMTSKCHYSIILASNILKMVCLYQKLKKKISEINWLIDLMCLILFQFAIHNFHWDDETRSKPERRRGQTYWGGRGIFPGFKFCDNKIKKRIFTVLR